MRTDPPPSEAVASGTRPPAIAAADPPLEPPGVRERFHGLRVVPKTRLRVKAVYPNSGVFVLPIGIAPARRRRATCVESWVATLFLKGTDPCVVGRPSRSPD